MELGIDLAWAKLQALAHAGMALLPNLSIALIVFAAVWYASGFVGRAVGSLLRRARVPGEVSVVVGRLVRAVVIVLGGLFAMTIVVPSLNAATVFSALGIGGVAIGFAFKDIFQNLLAGLLLLITRPFKIGDQIVTGNHTGTVEDIQLRATMLRTPDNRRVVIPNSDLYTNRVEVNTARDRRRAQVELKLPRRVDIDAARRMLVQAARQVEPVLEEPPPSAIVLRVEQGAPVVSLRFWVGPPKASDVAAATDAVLARVQPLLLSGLPLRALPPMGHGAATLPGTDAPSGMDRSGAMAGAGP